MLHKAPTLKPANFYKRVFFLFTLLISCFFYKTNAQTIYVDSSITASGNGSSWATAYKELRDALIVAGNDVSISEIQVAKGTYKPTDDNNVDSAFAIYRSNLKIYGDYPSGGGVRDINANKVNLSAIEPTPGFRTRHLFVIAGITAGADSIVLDGLTFSNGYANWESGSHVYNGEIIYANTGAGLCLQNNWSGCNIAVRNSIFTNNTANSGACIYSYSTGSLHIDNCSFNSNRGLGGLDAGVYSYGAGLYNYQTNTRVSNCSFSNNNFNRSGIGIGIYNENASIIVINSSFNRNTGPSEGAGIANMNGASADISYCTFTDNVSEASLGPLGRGSGIYNSASAINLHHSTFLRDTSHSDGALLLESSVSANINNVSFIKNYNITTNINGGCISNVACNPVISNCLFAMNTAAKGGALYNSAGASPIVSNCTFYKNLADYFGGAICCADSSGGKYRNCIFWQDTTYWDFYPDSYEFFSMNNGSNIAKPRPSISYSIIKSPFPITNVIDSGNNSNSYPLFADTFSIAGVDGLYGTGDDGLRLQPCSPGIDAGINSAIPAGIIKDIKDDARILNNTVDIGSYENASPAVVNATPIAVNGDSTIKSVYGTLHLFNDCRLIATITPAGAVPITDGIKAKVSIDPSGTLFSQPYVQRFYNIEPLKNPASATATLSLYFTQADFDAYNLVRGTYPLLPVDALDAANNKSNIVVHQFHGINGNGAETIIIPSDVVWSASNNWWVVTFQVAGFSIFYLNTSLTTLPVTLEYFKGQKQGKDIYLAWKLNCSNTSLTKIDLQKSSNGNAFTQLYSATATEQRCIQPFSYADPYPSAVENYYRLKISEAGGKITYSNTLFFNGNGPDIFVPGFIRRGQLLNITTPQKNYSIVIYNNVGVLVRKQQLLQEVNSIALTVQEGVYFYRVTDGEQHVIKTGGFIIM